MRTLLRTLLLLLALMTMGCAITAQNAASLTPEQIQALREQGHEIVKCVQIGGPPPSGNVTVLVIPKDSRAHLKFAPNCSILEGTLEVQSEQMLR